MIFTNDPLSDFLAYDARLADELSRCPICDCCNEPIQDDCYFETDDGIYCEECFNDEVVQEFRESCKRYI